MSEPPEKKHPWAKYYSERGATRPPVADLRRFEPRTSSGLKKPEETKESKKAAALSAELADAVAAVTAATPGLTAAPFITAMQKEAVARELQRRARLRIARFGLIVLGCLFALHISITQIIYRAPSEEDLADHVRDLPAQVVRMYSSAEQPLQAGDVRVVETDRISSRRIRYAALVTLVVRKPLYAPAVTNGTIAYRQLQESLQLARERDLKFELFPAGQNPPPPELPLLLHTVHREGEPIVVRVPFEAKRFTWPWRLQPPVLALRSVNRILTGDSIERYADSPYLIFGLPEAMAEIQVRMKKAREYIVAVAKEVQLRADVTAVDETPPASRPMAAEGAEPADGAAPAAGVMPADGTAPAEPAPPDAAKRPAFDPDAPAITLPPELSPPEKKAPGR